MTVKFRFEPLTIMTPKLFNNEQEETIVHKTAETFINLIAAHWPQIKEMSSDENADGKAKVSATFVFDWSGKTPAAGVEISFAPLKTKDGATVHIDDKDQPRLIEAE